ncbi:ankyrin repeat and SOCS box protein 12 [Rhinophrynus dorsalis]
MLRLRGNEDDLVETRDLHLAVSMDNPQLLSEMLSQKRYKELINSRSGWGVPGTPLRVAASQGSLECLKILLANRAEVDSLDVKAQTPLFTAVSAGHVECVRELLKAGANPCGSMYNNCSPVLTAARDGNVNILRELLDFGAEANVRSKACNWAVNNTASTGPLYLSAVYGHLECFRTLLLYGADPDYNCMDQKLLQRIKQPKTILEICLRHGCEASFVELLIEFGANVHLLDININNSFQNKEAVELLLREKAQPRSLMSRSRLTIRNLLRQKGRLNFIDQLELPKEMVKYLKYQTGTK